MNYSSLIDRLLALALDYRAEWKTAAAED